jgi:hypothetical protein
MDQRSPFLFNDPRGRVFVTGKSGDGKKFFEEGKDVCHFGFTIEESYGFGVTGVSVGVSVGGWKGVFDGEGVKVTVGV